MTPEITVSLDKNCFACYNKGNRRKKVCQVERLPRRAFVPLREKRGEKHGISEAERV